LAPVHRGAPPTGGLRLQVRWGTVTCGAGAVEGGSSVSGSGCWWLDAWGVGGRLLLQG